MTKMQQFRAVLMLARELKKLSRRARRRPRRARVARRKAA